jgi:hypothetical protein
MSPELQLPPTVTEVRPDARKERGSADQLISQIKDTRRIAQAASDKPTTLTAPILSIFELKPDTTNKVNSLGGGPAVFGSYDSFDNRGIYATTTVDNLRFTAGQTTENGKTFFTGQAVAAFKLGDSVSALGYYHQNKVGTAGLGLQTNFGSCIGGVFGELNTQDKVYGRATIACPLGR